MAAGRREYRGSVRRWVSTHMWISLALFGLLVLGCGGADPYGKWQLSSLNGQPALPWTQLTLELDDNSFHAFDGTNTTNGSYVYGTLEAGASGNFFLRHEETTEAGYPTPEDEEQAKNYLEALEMGEKYRVVDGQLEVLDREGQTMLVFVRESTLR